MVAIFLTGFIPFRFLCSPLVTHSLACFFVFFSVPRLVRTDSFRVLYTGYEYWFQLIVHLRFVLKLQQNKSLILGPVNSLQHFLLSLHKVRGTAF